MNKTIAITTAAFAAFACTPVLARTVSSDTIGFVQYISDEGAAARKYDATPGQLYATEFIDSGSNNVVALTIGTPGGERVPVADRYALRRRPAKVLTSQDYYIEFVSTNAACKLIDDHTVRMFESEIIPAWGSGGSGPPSPESGGSHYVTRTFKVKPLNGYQLLSVGLGEKESSFMESSLMNNNFGAFSHTELNGEVVIEALFRQFEKGVIEVNYYDITIGKVVGVESAQNADRIIDDFTDAVNDYYFRDDFGLSSLGGVRAWVDSKYKRYTADLWSNYPATNTVRLAGQSLRFNASSVITPDSIDDAVTWRVGASAFVALRVGPPGVNTNETFNIIGWEPNTPDHQVDTVWVEKKAATPFVDASASKLSVLYRTDLLDETWSRPPDGAVTVTRGTYDGEDAWCIAVDCSQYPLSVLSANRRFYRVIADDGSESGAYLFTEVPVFAQGGVCLKSPNGNWWKLVVDDSGSLGTTNITATVPDGVGRK